MPASLSMSDLRQLLAARFRSSTRKDGAPFITGIRKIDDPLGGGLPTGALSEFVSLAASSGAQLLQEALLQTARANRLRASLVDTGNAFDPDSASPNILPPLIWIRCPHLEAALQAADIVVRDSNIALTIIDLRNADPNKVRRTPTTLWYRLQRAAENTAAAVAVFTRTACIPSTRCRFLLNEPFHLNALESKREHLVEALSLVLQRSIQHTIPTESSAHVRSLSSSGLSTASPFETVAEHIRPARTA